MADNRTNNPLREILQNWESKQDHEVTMYDEAWDDANKITRMRERARTRSRKNWTKLYKEFGWPNTSSAQLKLAMADLEAARIGQIDNTGAPDKSLETPLMEVWLEVRSELYRNRFDEIFTLGSWMSFVLNETPEERMEAIMDYIWRLFKVACGKHEAIFHWVMPAGGWHDKATNDHICSIYHHFLAFAARFRTDNGYSAQFPKFIQNILEVPGTNSSNPDGQLMRKYGFYMPEVQRLKAKSKDTSHLDDAAFVPKFANALRKAEKNWDFIGMSDKIMEFLDTLDTQ